jgi:hypothetical protein
MIYNKYFIDVYFFFALSPAFFVFTIMDGCKCVFPVLKYENLSNYSEQMAQIIIMKKNASALSV